MLMKDIVIQETEKAKAAINTISNKRPETVNSIKFGVVDGPIVDYAKYNAWDTDILDMCKEYI